MRYIALAAPLLLVACGAADPTAVDSLLAFVEQNAGVVPGGAALVWAAKLGRKANAEFNKPSRASQDVAELRLQVAELRGEINALKEPRHVVAP